MTLRIGLSIDPSMPRFLDVARQAERIGVDSVWVAEYWACDAFTPLAAVAAVTERLRLATGIAQLGARTPAMLAMTAQGVQAVSDGRLILGIGTSGPQVMEGWHGVPFDRPVQRTRETIEIVRMITAGERLAYDGTVYQLPLPDSAGRAIRSRADVAPIPIYVASLGPANLRLTGELADGWIGNSFFTGSPDAFFGPIRRRCGARPDAALDDVDRVVAVGARVHRRRSGGDRARPVGVTPTGTRSRSGRWGRRRKNFYNDAFARQGYGDDVEAVRQPVGRRRPRRRGGPGADRDRLRHEPRSDHRRSSSSGWSTTSAPVSPRCGSTSTDRSTV